jgi:glycine/D-amino acid oxidase-like deaminating enzyme/nitrite reductase/ring-hydroxylating ferredoxin subunit
MQQMHTTESSTPAVSRAVWDADTDDFVFPALARDIDVDVAVVGGGITGISVAALLARAGKRVAVLEATRIGYGTTGSSTGNLYTTVGASLSELVEKWGVDTVREVVQSRAAAMAQIEQWISEHAIDCAYARQPWALYAPYAAAEFEQRLQREADAANACGLKARLVQDLPLPYPVQRALLIPDQAQFNPLRYVRQMAAAIVSPRCMLHEGTPVVEIDEEHGVLRTPGPRVRADHIVLATHTPKGLSVFHTALGPYREYAVAAAVESSLLPGGIFWSLGPESYSVRRAEIGGRAHVLLIGELHKTGQREDSDMAWQTLEQALRARFGIGVPTHRWAAQQYRAADYLPYIGPSPSSDHLHLACGYGPDGLVYGTLAAILIADRIAGRSNPWSELYSPRRFTPVKSAAQFVKENLNVAGYYVKDYFQGPDAATLDDVGRGEGRIMDSGGDKIAVYRDDKDRLHAVSAVCTHMKCVVHWNRAERSWDCPCHGSRFSPQGDVLEGPAMSPLARRALPTGPDPGS